MSYSAIYSALDAHVQGITGLPALQLENTSNIAKTGTPFSRLTILPARATQLTVGVDGRDQVSGLAQLDLFYPLNAGTATVNAMVDTVLDSFPRGLTLTSGDTQVHIQVVWREAGRRLDQFYNVPVVIQWSSIRP